MPCVDSNVYICQSYDRGDDLHTLMSKYHATHCWSHKSVLDYRPWKLLGCRSLAFLHVLLVRHSHPLLWIVFSWMFVWWMALEDRVSSLGAKPEHASGRDKGFVFLKFNATTMQTSSGPIPITPWDLRSKKTDTNNADAHAAGWIMSNKTLCIWPRSLRYASSIQKALAFYLLSFQVKWNFRYFTVLDSALPVTECWSPNATYLGYMLPILLPASTAL